MPCIINRITRYGTCVHAKLLKLCLILCDPTDYSRPGYSVYGILQARIWSGLPSPPPRDLPDLGIELVSLMSPALADGFFILAPPGKPIRYGSIRIFCL